MRVNQTLQDAVAEEFKRNYHAKITDPIFMNKAGTGTISISYVNRSLKKAFKKHEIEADQISSHMFRKSFSYRILEKHDFSDKSIFLVSRLLNHSTIAVTMKYLLLDTKEEMEAYDMLEL
jgi:integrase